MMTWLARAVALLLGTLASFVLALAIARVMGGEPLFRTVARLLFFALLALSALRTWRLPAGRSTRFRRRLLSLLAALSHAEAQREYAESTPGVQACEALWSDWSVTAAGLDEPGLQAAFDELELRELLALRAELEGLALGLPPWEGQPEDVLQELRFIDTEPAWVAIRRRSLRTLDRFIERARRPLEQTG